MHYYYWKANQGRRAAPKRKRTRIVWTVRDGTWKLEKMRRLREKSGPFFGVDAMPLRGWRMGGIGWRDEVG